MYDILKFLHIITAVFMSVPLYNLVVVNERGRMGKDVSVEVDRYFENIIRGGAKRCFVFQLTILISGILMLVTGIGLEALLSNAVLALKTVILFVLMGLLSHVHFGLQPRIDRLLGEVSAQRIPGEVLSELSPLRLRRKRLAAFCLFLLITEVILGVQTFAPLGIIITVMLLVIGALFTWHAYKSLIRFGWI
ncbi:MAG: hypothetical protein ACE5JC_00180 [Candidatus Zixiibacteriota bacterium]